MVKEFFDACGVDLQVVDGFCAEHFQAAVENFDRLNEVVHDDGSVDVEFEIALLAGQFDSAVVAEDLEADHFHAFSD